MTLSKEEKAVPVKYLYYDYHNGHIAREKFGSSYSDGYRFEFYEKSRGWVHDDSMSLHLSDAIMGCCGYSFGDYEELTEQQALRLISEIESK